MGFIWDFWDSRDLSRIFGIYGIHVIYGICPEFLGFIGFIGFLWDVWYSFGIYWPHENCGIDLGFMRFMIFIWDLRDLFGIHGIHLGFVEFNWLMGVEFPSTRKWNLCFRAFCNDVLACFSTPTRGLNAMVEIDTLVPQDDALVRNPGTGWLVRDPQKEGVAKL